MDSLQVAASLKHYGFQEVETKTHAVGYTHPALAGQRVYVKVARSERKEKAAAMDKQPLVLHPMVARRPGFGATRIAQIGANHAYKNTNMSTFPHKPGESACGIAVDVPDIDALLELLAVLGVQSAPVSGVVGAPEAPPEFIQVSSATPAVAPVLAQSPAPQPVARKATGSSTTFHARQDIDLAAHCCQGTDTLKAGSFGLDAAGPGGHHAGWSDRTLRGCLGNDVRGGGRESCGIPRSANRDQATSTRAWVCRDVGDIP